MNNSRLAALFVFFCLHIPALSYAVTVSNVSQLQNAVTNANSGGDKQIVISSGVYHLAGIYLRVTASGVTVRGASGKRSDVVIDGDYQTTEIFQVLGSNFSLRDLTLKRAVYHPIHIFPNSHNITGTSIKNVHIIDPGQQAIKINQNGAKTLSANFGTIEKSKIELTAAGRNKVWQINGSCYTGGIDVHHGKGWNIKDNLITGFWCAGGLSEHGVHFWSFSEDTVVERNQIINCDRGIGFGLGSSGHIGGIIRNNFIYHDTGYSYSDVGIGLESASGAQVYNNTIFHEHSYANGIEYRFSATNNGIIYNNLTNKSIASRNGGSASLSHNLTSANAGWFKDLSAGDLHLIRAVSSVVDRGQSLSGLRDDFDQESRPMGSGIDIGADEWTATRATISSWLQLLLE